MGFLFFYNPKQSSSIQNLFLKMVDVPSEHPSFDDQGCSRYGENLIMRS